MVESNNFVLSRLAQTFRSTMNDYHAVVDRHMDLKVYITKKTITVTYDGTIYSITAAYGINAQGLYERDIYYVYTEYDSDANVQNTIVSQDLKPLLDFVEDTVHNELDQNVYFTNTEEYDERNAGLDVEAQKLVG